MDVVHHKSLPRRIWEHRHFYLFISPFFMLFAVFGLYPLLFSLYLSFTKWDGLTDIQWFGLGNFSILLADDTFRTALWNTLVIGLLYIPPMFAGAFLFALILNSSWIKLRALFRAAFFLPCVTPMVVVAVIFLILYNAEKGLINALINATREGLVAVTPADWGWLWQWIQPVPWLNSERMSKVSIAILLLWRWTGYNMILMLAGLQGISAEYYEAAAIDGASRWQRTWHITLPLMRPIFVFCGIMSLIGTMYMFDEIFVLTVGGPGTSSTNFGLYLFNTSFIDFKFGYASCMAYTVAFCVFVTSLLILKLRKTGA